MVASYLNIVAQSSSIPPLSEHVRCVRIAPCHKNSLCTSDASVYVYCDCECEFYYFALKVSFHSIVIVMIAIILLFFISTLLDNDPPDVVSFSFTTEEFLDTNMT